MVQCLCRYVYVDYFFKIHIAIFSKSTIAKLIYIAALFNCQRLPISYIVTLISYALIQNVGWSIRKIITKTKRRTLQQLHALQQLRRTVHLIGIG